MRSSYCRLQGLALQPDNLTLFKWHPQSSGKLSVPQSWKIWLLNCASPIREKHFNEARRVILHP